MTSLQDFAAKAAPKKTRCFTCNLPDAIRAEVEAGHDKYTLQVISDWLKTEGFSIHAATIHNHFARGHAKTSEANA